LLFCVSSLVTIKVVSIVTIGYQLDEHNFSSCHVTTRPYLYSVITVYSVYGELTALNRREHCKPV